MSTTNTQDGPAGNPLAELLNFDREGEVHIMLDIETLGTTAGSVVLSVGATAFNNRGLRGTPFYKRIDLHQSLAAGFKVDADTLRWWMKPENDKARAEAFALGGEETINPYLFLQSFREWLKVFLYGRPVLWGNGAAFDPVLLEAYYKHWQYPVPWQFRDIRCFRTVRAMMRQRSNVFKQIWDADPNRIAHHALHDAMRQAEELIHYRNVLIGMGETEDDRAEAQGRGDMGDGCGPQIAPISADGDRAEAQRRGEGVEVMIGGGVAPVPMDARLSIRFTVA